MIDSEAITGPIDTTDYTWLYEQPLDVETAQDFATLDRIRDLSDDRLAVLSFLYGTILESHLQDARWPDAAAMWHALRMLDPGGWIARLAGLRPALTSTGSIDSNQISGVIIRARASVGVHPLRALWHCQDPRVFEFGQNDLEVSARLLELVEVSREGWEDPVAIDDIDGEVGRLRASMCELSPKLDARIRLVVRANGSRDNLGWALALAAALGERHCSTAAMWQEIASMRADPASAFRSKYYQVPSGQPTAWLDNEDLGPHALQLRAIYERSAALSREEVVRLVDAWTTIPWDSHAYDRVRDVGQVARPTAYAVARRLGALELPQRARLAIKDAAGAIALRDLVDPADFEILTNAWTSAIVRPLPDDDSP